MHARQTNAWFVYSQSSFLETHVFHGDDLYVFIKYKGVSGIIITERQDKIYLSFPQDQQGCVQSKGNKTNDPDYYHTNKKNPLAVQSFILKENAFLSYIWLTSW